MPRCFFAAAVDAHGKPGEVIIDRAAALAYVIVKLMPDAVRNSAGVARDRRTRSAGGPPPWDHLYRRTGATMIVTKQLVSKGTGLAMLACVLAAGCGGGSSTAKQAATASTGASASSTASTTSVGTATTAASATTAKPAGGATTTVGSAGSSDAYSAALVAAFNAAASGDCGKAAAIGTSKLGGASPTAAGTIAGVAKAMATLSSSGPSELRADFATMAKAFTSAATLYQSLGLDDPSKIASIAKDPAMQAQLAQASALFDDPAFTAASGRIDAWANAKCPGVLK